MRWRLLGTSTPTACLPGIGARMRMSVEASAYAMSSFSWVTFETLVPGREPQLVARHARAGDLPDDLRLDAEVAERLDQQLRDLVLVGGVGPLALAGVAQQLRIGQRVAEAVGLGDRRAALALRREERRDRSCPPGSRGSRLAAADLALDLRQRVLLLALERLVLGGDASRPRRWAAPRPRARGAAPRCAARPPAPRRPCAACGVGAARARARRPRGRAGRARRCAAPPISWEIDAPVRSSSAAEEHEDEREMGAGVARRASRSPSRASRPRRRRGPSSGPVSNRSRCEAPSGPEAERAGGEAERQREHQHDRARCACAAATRDAAARRARRPRRSRTAARGRRPRRPGSAGRRRAACPTAPPSEPVHRTNPSSRPAADQAEPDRVERRLLELGDARQLRARQNVESLRAAPRRLRRRRPRAPRGAGASPAGRAGGFFLRRLEVCAMGDRPLEAGSIADFDAPAPPLPPAVPWHSLSARGNRGRHRRRDAASGARSRGCSPPAASTCWSPTWTRRPRGRPPTCSAARLADGAGRARPRSHRAAAAARPPSAARSRSGSTTPASCAPRRPGSTPTTRCG